MIFPIILCGGSGTRLWPLSRNKHPKQFIKLGDSSLFSKTIDRILELGFTQSCILCNNEQRFLAANELLEKDLSPKKHAILLEPMARNTAPALALAAFKTLAEDEHAILLVLPSDHLLDPLSAFAEALNYAETLAEQGYIITFGINPTEPTSGYGYIEKGEEIIAHTAYKIGLFVEKPAKEKAEKLIQEGAAWNSGIFMLKASVYLEELQKFRPDIYAQAKQIWESHYTDLDFTRFNAELFASCPSESIDFAVMEHTQKGVLMPLNLYWSDLGSWDALYKVHKHDANGNALVGDCVAYDTHNSYIHATNGLVAVLGLDNIAVVETQDAVLVADRTRSQEVKCIIEILKKQKRTEYDEHTVIHRPWGYYESIVQSERFQVKHITVKPKGILSMQLHHHRSEHWVVVRGTAIVVCGDTERMLKEDESIYIPLGVKHRLVNPGCIPLEVVEIQTGSYLGEDDITRFEDLYNRHTELS